MLFITIALWYRNEKVFKFEIAILIYIQSLFYLPSLSAPTVTEAHRGKFPPGIKNSLSGLLYFISGRLKM